MVSLTYYSFSLSLACRCRCCCCLHIISQDPFLSPTFSSLSSRVTKSMSKVTRWTRLVNDPLLACLFIVFTTLIDSPSFQLFWFLVFGTLKFFSMGSFVPVTVCVSFPIEKFLNCLLILHPPSQGYTWIFGTANNILWTFIPHCILNTFWKDLLLHILAFNTLHYITFFSSYSCLPLANLYLFICQGTMDKVTSATRNLVTLLTYPFCCYFLFLPFSFSFFLSSLSLTN